MTVIIALDNVTVTAEDQPQEVILALAELQNHILEKNREVIADAWVDLICFGHAQWNLSL